jgi:hypothetical protein
MAYLFKAVDHVSPPHILELKESRPETAIWSLIVKDRVDYIYIIMEKMLIWEPYR